MWCEKYRPGNFDNIIGNQSLKENIKSYNWVQPLIVYGAIGVGKTAFVNAAANEFGWGVVEITDENLDSSSKIATTSSLFGTKKLVVIDNF